MRTRCRHYDGARSLDRKKHGPDLETPGTWVDPGIIFVSFSSRETQEILKSIGDCS
jgi:hypothetical protein